MKFWIAEYLISVCQICVQKSQSLCSFKSTIMQHDKGKMQVEGIMTFP